MFIRELNFGIIQNFDLKDVLGVEIDIFFLFINLEVFNIICVV